MRKEDFFEILGELDDRLVEEAGVPVRKKRNWKILGTMAACITLACITLGYFSFTGHYGESAQESPAAEAPAEESPVADASAEEAPAEEPPIGDIAPMVCVNDTLYIQSSGQEGYTEWREEFSYLGEIESAVSSDREPEQNFQANDPIVGCEVYQYGDDVVIKINGSYWLYVKIQKCGEP